MRDAVFLAWRGVRAAPGRTVVLASASAVALFLPLFTWLAAELIEARLLLRARSTPLVVGAKGNEFDLTMASLYFRGQIRDPLQYGERRLITGAAVVPLLLRDTIGGVPVVGTVPEYYAWRGLEPIQGRLPALLGEVVVGERLARQRELRPGSVVRSDLLNLYNLAGAYPTLLDVVGVLAATGTPDDEAFFCDLKTAWMLDGRLHGHAPLRLEDTVQRGPGEASPTESEEIVPKGSETEGSETRDVEPGVAEQEPLEATAALFLFQEINEHNRDSFHLHGDPDEAPVSSFLIFPDGERQHDLLLGDFALDERLQAIRPEEVLRTVLGIVLRARSLLSSVFVVVAATTAMLLLLVVSLLRRLRSDEIELMVRMGGSRARVAAVLGLELGMIALLALGMAASAMVAGASWVLTSL